jgi:indole-3-glycerol phosphate synthase
MSYLDRIFQAKHEEVEEAIHRVPLGEVRAQAEDAEAPRGFKRSLDECKRQLALIAEIKKASPSKGLIRPNLDVIEVAEAYASSGAHALSVLTDERFFQGSAKNLLIAHRAVSLPILRKDFIFHPYQIYQARAWGADAILLIVASLERSQIEDLQGLAKELGMDVLVEVHSEQEAEIALDSGSDLIGINNRDLTDFSTSLDMTERIAPMLKGNATVVSESALSTNEDLRRVAEAGARAVLIGTTFCASENIEAKVKEVMGW